jgi:hypothetical protein
MFSRGMAFASEWSHRPAHKRLVECDVRWNGQPYQQLLGLENLFAAFVESIASYQRPLMTDIDRHVSFQACTRPRLLP